MVDAHPDLPEGKATHPQNGVSKISLIFLNNNNFPPSRRKGMEAFDFNNYGMAIIPNNNHILFPPNNRVDGCWRNTKYQFS